MCFSIDVEIVKENEYTQIMEATHMYVDGYTRTKMCSTNIFILCKVF